jgi:hypothetical protein
MMQILLHFFSNLVGWSTGVPRQIASPQQSVGVVGHLRTSLPAPSGSWDGTCPRTFSKDGLGMLAMRRRRCTSPPLKDSLT